MWVTAGLPPQHLGSIYRSALEFAGSYANDPDPEVLLRLKQTVDSVTGMLYQRANIPLEVPFSEFLFDLAKVDEVPEEEKATDDSVLALTDESTQANPLDADALARMQAEQLAQGLEQVQQYEDLQRQEIAADTISDVAPVAQEMMEAKPA